MHVCNIKIWEICWFFTFLLNARLLVYLLLGMALLDSSEVYCLVLTICLPFTVHSYCEKFERAVRISSFRKEGFLILDLISNRQKILFDHYKRNLYGRITKTSLSLFSPKNKKGKLATCFCQKRDSLMVILTTEHSYKIRTVLAVESETLDLEVLPDWTH